MARSSTTFKKGHFVSEEVGEKIRLANKGKHYSLATEIKEGEHLSLTTEFKKEQVPWNKGLTKETDERVKLYGQRGGETQRASHPNWKITSLVQRIRRSYKYRQWRSDVFTRDDFTCQECGRRGSTLNAHHAPDSFTFIMGLNDITTLEQALNCEELWNINNGTTLCLKCHNLTKNGGKTNGNSEICQ